jgi:hypothetical protein
MEQSDDQTVRNKLPSLLRCKVKYVPNLLRFENPFLGVTFLADMLIT